MKKFLFIFAVAFIVFLKITAPVFADLSVNKQITKIENEIWGFSHENENDAERITRIEKQVFGASNSNLAVQQRIDKITKALGLETLKEAESSLSDLYVAESTGQNVEYPQIDALESELLGSVYKKENIYARLERLEKKTFGAKQDGDLSTRTDNLKRHLSHTEENRNITSQKQYFENNFSNNNESNYGAYYDNEIKFQLSALENAIFSTEFPEEPVALRLTRLENKIFQRDFHEDETTTRISRIQAAATAGKTAKYYDNNKFQKFASTGLQAASFILMILAFIL